MLDLCFDILGVEKEKRDPKSIQQNRGAVLCSLRMQGNSTQIHLMQLPVAKFVKEIYVTIVM